MTELEWTQRGRLMLTTVGHKREKSIEKLKKKKKQKKQKNAITGDGGGSDSSDSLNAAWHLIFDLCNFGWH